MPSLPYMVLCAALSLVWCMVSRPIAARLRLLDLPDTRKRHTHATPLMGGIVLLGAFTPAFIVAQLQIGDPLQTARMGLLLVAIVVVTLLGILDDRHALSPALRLLVGFGVFAATALLDRAFLVRYLSFETPAFAFGFGELPVALLFTSVCCVGLINAVNMADGKNGLVVGLCLNWVVLLMFRAPPEFLLPLSLLGSALAVLLVFNMRGLLFLGDGGAYGLSAAIGLIGIACYNSPGVHAGRAIAAEELAALFAVPVLDSFRLAFVRIRRGQSPMAPDRNHLHHHLQDRFGWPGGLVIYLLIAQAVVVLAFAHS